MEKYFYTKEGIDSEVLNEAIRLRTSLRVEFIGGLTSDKRDANGAIKDDNIELHFTRALISSEQDEITSLVNMIGPSYDLMIRKNLEKNTMAWAIKSGQEIIAQLGANNLYRGKDASQIKALAIDYPDLVHSLITGSLQTTYGIFSVMAPSANISQEEIDEFKLRLEIILGL
jgi:hypothetical protein